VLVLAERKVLVLNKSWRAIAIITLEKALSKVFSTYDDGTPKAKIIDPSNDFMMFEWHEWSQIMPNDNELKIRTVSAAYRVPEVIQYTKYDKVPCTKAQFNRRSIYRRDNSTCQYCGEKKKNDELSLDHIVPRCQGGKTNWENIVVACVGCNSQKAGRTPKQAGMKLLRDPKKPLSNLYLDDSRVESWVHFLVQEDVA
jgi:5-methylcytosine-specific restriction endonuclease McrA